MFPLFSSRGIVVTLIGLIFVLLLAIVYGVWQIALEQKEPEAVAPTPTNTTTVSNNDNVNLQDTTTAKADIVGLLFMSGLDKSGTVGATSSVMSYSLQFDADTPNLFNETKAYGFPSSSFLEFTDTTEPETFYARAFVKVADSVTETTNTLFYVDLPDTLKKVSDDYGQQFGVVAYANATKLLAMMSLQPDTQYTTASTTIADWRIQIMDGDTVRNEIAGAAHPTWSPRGIELIYLKQDGLFMFDTSDGTETRLSTMTAKKTDGTVVSLSPSTMIETSPDGKYLILTTESSGRIEVYTIDWDTKQLSFVGRIVDEDTEYSWPVVAPNNKTYAVLARDVVADEFTNPRVEIRAIEGRTILESYSLANFDPIQIMLDDWTWRAISL